MSSFQKYKSIYNFLELSDEEIQTIYFKCERGYNNEYACCYYIHIPRTNKEINDSDFLKNSVVKTVYNKLTDNVFLKKMINDPKMKYVVEKIIVYCEKHCHIKY